MSAQKSSVNRWNSDHVMAVLRIALGGIFLIGGVKLAFPADPQGLVDGYIDPVKGWISPFFVQQISDMLGMDISAFLNAQGVVEMAVGMMMIMGMITPVAATLMGLMFWAFTVANPLAGEIRLSRDIALMGFSFAVALNGAGAWSMDSLMLKRRSNFTRKKDLILILIRLSLAFTLLSSSMFTGGLFASHLNTTLPTGMVLAIGILLVVGLLPRWLMAILFAWMLYLLGNSLLSKDLFLAIDSVKRELGFLAASFVYFLLGPDRWAFPRPKRSTPP